MPRNTFARKQRITSTPARRLAAAGVAVLAAGAVAAPAQAQAPVGIGTAPIGPITERFGFFPEYYSDAAGTQLQLCIYDAACAVTPPNAGAPISFPGNFPVEMFYWSATADAGGAALTLAQEATFDGIDGNQAVFGRTRVRIRNIPAGHYRFTTPYGQFEAITDAKADQGTDVGCGPLIGAACDPTTFTATGGSAIGPNFLTALSPAPPAGFVGDGLTASTVTGSVFTPDPATVDGLPPAISLAVGAANPAQDNSGTVAVQYTPSALDDVDGARPATCTPTPARLPADGTTADTTCTSTDLSTPANTGTRVFHISVPDTTPPHITVPTSANVGTVDGDGNYPVDFSVSASDIVDGNTDVVCSKESGDAFPARPTTVTCTSTDAHNNTASDTFDVTVTPDTIDPTTATVTVGNPTVNETVGAVSPVVTADAQVNPPAAVANYFRVDQINAAGKIVNHFGADHRTTLFTVLGKLADAVAQPQFLSTGGAFGVVHQGTPVTQDITIRNGGSGPLNLTTPSISGSPDFALVANTCANSTIDPAPRTAPPTTPAKPTCTATVRFTPSAVASRTATLTVNEAGTPHTVALTGAGTLAAVTADKQGLAFGNQIVGTSTAPQTVRVTNSGGSPLNVTGTSFTGAAAADYLATPSGCTNVAPGASCTIDVMFTPTAAGVRNATLQIATVEAGITAVPVSGVGVALAGGGVAAGGGAAAAGAAAANAGSGGVIAPVITPQLIVPVGQPPASKTAVKSLTLKVGPSRDVTLPLQFTISGELKVPKGVSLAKSCTGNMAISLKRGSKAVLKSSPKLRLIASRTRCVYSSKVTVRSRSLVGARTSRLTVTANYAGSSLLKSAARNTSISIR